mmetsp:Transcript_7054/g.17056  ORF Transcript_7054/g.17056 Transcript_7054/m.17056 type:complete len:218 (-) Transcript_7054:51-704(-)
MKQEHGRLNTWSKQALKGAPTATALKVASPAGMERPLRLRLGSSLLSVGSQGGWGGVSALDDADDLAENPLRVLLQDIKGLVQVDKLELGVHPRHHLPLVQQRPHVLSEALSEVALVRRLPAADRAPSHGEPLLKHRLEGECCGIGRDRHEQQLALEAQAGAVFLRGHCANVDNDVNAATLGMVHHLMHNILRLKVNRKLHPEGLGHFHLLLAPACC